MGAINRPGRFGGSSACGALCACLAGLQSGDKSCTELAEPGTHDVTDPELSILKQRLLRQVKKDNVNVEKLDLVKLTKLCERSHTSDMEQLIEAAVDTSKADYALITGVQIHNWTTYPTDSKSPDLEYIWPAQFTTVINGVKSSVSLDTIPSMTPRQIRLLANEDKVYGTPAGSVIHGTDILKRQRMATELIRKAMTA